MKLKKIIIFLLLTASAAVLYAQEPDSVTIAPLDTVRTHKVVYPEHLIGIRYSYCFTGVKTNVDVNQTGYKSPLNLELLYTYYHPLWGYIGYFGLQTGIRYTKFGFTSDANIRNFDQTVTTLQLPLLSAFHFDIGKHLRIYLSIGPYFGYRLSTTKDEGWDCFDRRFEWGIEGQGGVGLRFGRVEFHLGAGYQFCLGFLYDPEKYSSATWLYTYPHSFSVGGAVHFKLK